MVWAAELSMWVVPIKKTKKKTLPNLLCQCQITFLGSDSCFVSSKDWMFEVKVFYLRNRGTQQCVGKSYTNPTAWHFFLVPATSLVRLCSFVNQHFVKNGWRWWWASFFQWRRFHMTSSHCLHQKLFGINTEDLWQNNIESQEAVQRNWIKMQKCTHFVLCFWG